MIAFTCRLPRPSAAALVVLLSLSAVSTARGQVLKGQILGSLTDATSAVVPTAKVTLTDTGKGVQSSSLTNAQGNYVFVNLDAGIYELVVEQPGFNRGVRGGIVLQPNTTVRVIVELQPGNVTEVVQVSASAPLLQPDRSDTGGQIDQVQLQNMPLLFNRNYQGLLLLVPGVGRPFRPHSVFYNSQDSLSVR